MQLGKLEKRITWSSKGLEMRVHNEKWPHIWRCGHTMEYYITINIR